MKPAIRKAVFPVGGLGTRFLPITKALPKEMLPVVDKPLIHYAVEEAQAAGIEEFIFVTGRGKSAIEDHFDLSYELQEELKARGKISALESVRRGMPSAGQVAYTRQQHPLGLGHAVWCARNLVGDEPFAVILADDLIMSPKPCLKQMIEAYGEVGGNLVAVMSVKPSQVVRYGIIDSPSPNERLAKITGLVEKPNEEDAPSNLAVIGRYILLPEIFEYLDRMERGAEGEIQLTDAMSSLIGASPFHALRFTGTRFDCGDKIGFLQANVAFGLARDELHAELKSYLRDVLSDDLPQPNSAAQ